MVAGRPGRWSSAGSTRRRSTGSAACGGAVLPDPRLRTLRDGHADRLHHRHPRRLPARSPSLAVGPLTEHRAGGPQGAPGRRVGPRVRDHGRELHARQPAPRPRSSTSRPTPRRRRSSSAPGGRSTRSGLDVSLTPPRDRGGAGAMRSLGRLGGDLLIPSLEFYGMTTAHDGPAVHDALAVAYVADPSLFEFTPAVVDVETAGRFHLGMTWSPTSTLRGRHAPRECAGVDRREAVLGPTLWRASPGCRIGFPDTATWTH